MQPSSKSKTKPRPRNIQFAFEAIGTQWQIDVVAEPAEVNGIEEAIRERIAAFDATYSRFRDDSWVAERARRKGPAVLPPDAQPLLDIYQTMYTLTGGAVTPLIAQVLSDAGYDASYSLQPKQLHTPPAWEDVLSYDSAAQSLIMRQPALLDFGAAGKGYLVDLVCELLDRRNVLAYCVDAGGDMRQRLGHGQPPLRVGMEHPDNPGQVVGVVELGDYSLCGSAGNRRQWAGLHHIMNPHTLEPVRDIKAVWTAAPAAMVADAMATCLFFLPGDILQKHFDFSYTIIYSDNSYFRSPSFPGKLFAEG